MEGPGSPVAAGNCIAASRGQFSSLLAGLLQQRLRLSFLQPAVDFAFRLQPVFELLPGAEAASLGAPVGGFGDTRLSIL